MTDEFDISKALEDVGKFQRIRKGEYEFRKKALEDAFELANRLIRPVVNEEIKALRADETLEPKPGYIVSGSLLVDQMLPLAAFMVGDHVKHVAPRFGSYATYPVDNSPAAASHAPRPERGGPD